ncbi:hypothetical protein Tco_1241138 [Tanacetum coccineum]
MCEYATSVGEESHLAIETNGHGATKENHWLDDGAYLMALALLTGDSSSRVLRDNARLEIGVNAPLNPSIRKEK